MKGTVIPVVIRALGTIPKGLIKKLEELEDEQRHPNYSVVNIGQDTGKTSGDLRKLAVAQTLVKDHQFTPMRKSRKE